MSPRELRRTFLWSAVGCLAITAFVAILAILSGDFGETQVRVLATSGAVSGASVCAMACAAFRERGCVPVLGTLGIAVAGVALVVVLATVWQHRPGEAWLRATALAAIWSVGVAHAELLLLPRLAAQHGWLQVAAVAAVVVLATELSMVILGDWSNHAAGRATAVLAVVVALLTLVVPIVARLGSEAPARTRTAEPDRLVLQRGVDGTWSDATGIRYTVTPVADG